MEPVPLPPMPKHELGLNDTIITTSGNYPAAAVAPHKQDDNNSQEDMDNDSDELPDYNKNSCVPQHSVWLEVTT